MARRPEGTAASRRSPAQPRLEQSPEVAPHQPDHIGLAVAPPQQLRHQNRQLSVAIHQRLEVAVHVCAEGDVRRRHNLGEREDAINEADLGTSCSNCPRSAYRAASVDIGASSKCAFIHAVQRRHTSRALIGSAGL
jgi:hypothetical protein